MDYPGELWQGEQRFYHRVELGFLIVALVIFPILRYVVSAPYGRHLNRYWGPSISGKLAWFTMELPTFAVLAWFFAGDGQCITNTANMALLGLYVLHYIHRVLIYPWFIITKPMPVFVWALAFITNVFASYMHGRYLGAYSFGYPTDWLLSPQFVLGVVIFFVGMIINIHSDYTLIYLRKPGELEYKIPRGGCFEYVSAANMFGEMVEWLGFAIACWSLSGFAWWIYVIGNLGPRAIAHHRWYHQYFKQSYPKNRKALIPFVY